MLWLREICRNKFAPLPKMRSCIVKSKTAYQASSLSWNEPIQQVVLKNFIYSDKKLQNMLNLPMKVYYYYYHYYYFFHSNQKKCFLGHIYRNRLFRPLLNFLNPKLKYYTNVFYIYCIFLFTRQLLRNFQLWKSLKHKQLWGAVWSHHSSLYKVYMDETKAIVSSYFRHAFSY